MGKINNRYCLKAIPKQGWRIWDRKLNKFWGNISKDVPTETLNILNSGNKSNLKY